MNMCWCQGDKYICHSGIFRFLCLFFLAPKFKQESVPWHIYSPCGCLGYHPVRAWLICNYAGAQRIEMLSDFNVLVSNQEIKYSNFSNKSHKLLLWSDIRHEWKKCFCQTNFDRLMTCSKAFGHMKFWCPRFCYSDHWFFE